MTKLKPAKEVVVQVKEARNEALEQLLGNIQASLEGGELTDQGSLLIDVGSFRNTTAIERAADALRDAGYKTCLVETIEGEQSTLSLRISVLHLLK
jgi:hypothetical protein